MQFIAKKDFTEKAPSFTVNSGIVTYFHPDQRYGGMVGVGQEVSWEEHGTFVVEYVGSDCAIIRNDDFSGNKFFVPPKMKVWAHRIETVSHYVDG